MGSETRKCEAESLVGLTCMLPAGHDGRHRRHVNGGSEAVWTRDHSGYLNLCTHRNVEGQCDRCAADGDRDRKAADYDRLAGEVERLTRERDEARAEIDRAWAATGVSGSVRGLTTLDDVIAVHRRERDEAQARVDALVRDVNWRAAVLRELTTVRPTTDDEAVRAAEEASVMFQRGRRAGVEEAAKVCDDWRTLYDAEQPVVGSWAVGVGAELFATGIRALLDTKEVRDAEG